MKQWKSFLSSSSNKHKLIQFFVNKWKPKANQSIGSKALFVTFHKICLRFSAEGFTEEPALQSNEKETDTRMLPSLNFKTTRWGNPDLIVHTLHTDWRKSRIKWLLVSKWTDHKKGLKFVKMPPAWCQLWEFFSCNGGIWVDKVWDSLTFESIKSCTNKFFIEIFFFCTTKNLTNFQTATAWFLSCLTTY